MIWREKRIVLAIVALLLVANAGFFFTYRVQYQSRLQALDTRLTEAEDQLKQARTARVGVEGQYQSYKKIEKDVQQIYDRHWATQQERLTAMIIEVKRLAEASTLAPGALAFDRTKVEIKNIAPQAGRRQGNLGATEVGIAFSVDATYPQARRLINLLELSQQFVIIQQLGLAAREGDRLNLNLVLKTLFRDAKSDVTGQQL